MAGTTIKTIQSNVWTEIATAGTSGYFQNTENREIVIRESATDPGMSVKKGHEYKATDKDVYTNTIGLWAKVTDASQEVSSGSITVTEY